MEASNFKFKNVLGLDLGTNSIGWALISIPEDFNDYGKSGKIFKIGTRILPDTDYTKYFEVGQTSSVKSKTPAAVRREKRGSRRLKHRYKLRRTRLIKVFKTLGWLSEEFPEDFTEFKKEQKKFKISDYIIISDQTYKEFYREFGYSEDQINTILEEIKYRRLHKKKNNENIKLLPEDWIVYYLRKKALSEKIEIPELVRIIYMLNQRRGFISSRKDLKETYVLPYDEFKNRREKKDFGDNGIETKFVTITKVKSVSRLKETINKDGKIKYKFRIELEDERVEPYDIEYANEKGPDWLGKEFTFIVTQKIDTKGNFHQNKPQIPDDNSWDLCTTALDEKIQLYEYPGKYFYNELVKAFKEKRNFKIRQFPVFRWRYQKELEAIWRKQCELNPELNKINNDKNILKKLAEVLYPTQSKFNMPKLIEFLNHDLLHVISKDIIYYQRELKSQKKLISECRYEKRTGIEKDEKGNFIKTGKYGLKCTPKSSPLFQEFRIWQDIHNIRILKREEIIDGKTILDVDYTNKFINNNVKVSLFNLFNQKSEIKETDILKLIKELNPESDIEFYDKKEIPCSHRINLFRNRDTLKGNEIKSRYRSIFKKAEYDGEDILANEELLFKLWNADYSITSSDESKSKKGIRTSLGKILPDRQNKDKVIDLFLKIPELKKEYGAYSALAIKKLLPLMRVGKFWNENNIHENTKKRIEKLITGEYDESINDNLRERIKKWKNQNHSLKEISDFQGLPVWLACYVVYGIHSENEFIKCENSEDFNREIILKLKNNSLRNPVVEQVIRETLLVVRDLWKELELEKNGEKIDEIHIELARELKNNSEEKQKIAEAQKRNFEEKEKIKVILKNLLNDSFFTQYIDKPEPTYEDGKPIVVEEQTTSFEVKPNPENPLDIEKFRIWKSLSKSSDDEWEKIKEENIPKEQQIKKYILWLSQYCRSPYTGKIIPLSKLFDSKQYEIEHIIPRSKLKNDSINNLVICELGINKAKGNQLAANFIKNSNGKCKYGETEYTLFTYAEYTQYVKDTFKFNKAKQKNLLATDVPDDFVLRQINDTRYISRKVVEFLKPVVGDETKIIFSTGSITSELKMNWGLNKEWKKLMMPRFKRLESITGKTHVVNEFDEHGNLSDIHFYVPENPHLNVKRIDHRHHALDALIVAATTREHIRYLNSLNAVDSNEELKKVQRTLVKEKIREFKLPWKNFTKEAREKLEQTVVSFKTNNKILSKPRNLYYVWDIQNDKPIKILKEQVPKKNWMAVRRPLFKEPLGVMWLKETKDVSVKDAFKIEIERQLNYFDPDKRKTLPYIYDKMARQIIRQIIKDIISKCNASIDDKDALMTEIENYLKKNKKAKNIYRLNGMEFSKITIAEFNSYKTKRMSLSNKEYFNKLTLEKMINDFPYFNFLSKEQFENLSNNKKEIILKHNNSAKDVKKILISESKKMSPLNFLFLNHILDYKNNPKDAFSSEGIDKLNTNAIKILGKEIKSITRLDGKVDIEDMFNGGYYETDKGAMAYFVIYENIKTKEREDFVSIPTHKAVERIIQGKPIAEDREGYNKITLSPGDLVYLPTKDEIKKIKENTDFSEILKNKSVKEIANSIYVVRKFTGKQCYFLKSQISELIIPYKEVDTKTEEPNDNISNKKHKIGEFGSQNLQEVCDEGLKISAYCVKLNIDRLGRINTT